MVVGGRFGFDLRGAGRGGAAGAGARVFGRGRRRDQGGLALHVYVLHDTGLGGDVQVAEVLSTDGAVQVNNFVVLDDDKHLQNADNVVPIIRNNKLNNEIRDLWNSVSAKLTTSELVGMNKSLDVDKQDPDVVATNWLRKEGFKT